MGSVVFCLVARNAVLSVPFLLLVTLFLSDGALAREPFFDSLAWPPSSVEFDDNHTPISYSKNLGKRLLRYCIHQDAVLWPLNKHFYSSSYAVDYILGRLSRYIDLKFKRVEDVDCDLSYNFQPYNGKSVGIYYPRENAIFIQTGRNLTIWETFKVIAHETLHALGLGHNIKTRHTIMGPRLSNATAQLLFKSDVQALSRLWKRPRLFYKGKRRDNFDYYDINMEYDTNKRRG